MGKRYDDHHRLLKEGEVQRKDGYYQYRWTDRWGKRHSLTAKTLSLLREKENEILLDKLDGIRAESRNYTLDDLFNMWCKLKRGLQDNTFQNYKYLYKSFVSPYIGSCILINLHRSDIKKLYNQLLDEQNLKVNTLDSVHTVLRQVFQLAVEDNFIRQNLCDNLMKEIKQTRNEGRPNKRALTLPEQELFLEYISRENNKYYHWYPIFVIMLGTGMRVGETVGLRWEDIDLDKGVISVKHTLVYYKHESGRCYFNVHPTKTKAGTREIPMLDYVKEAFLLEKEMQKLTVIKCKAEIDGYSGFIFTNRFGDALHQGILNKALRRIIRDCNKEQLSKGEDDPVLLPDFSCHILRHTAATRMLEAGLNVKVLQAVLGHADYQTTMDIYVDVTNELKEREFKMIQSKMNRNKRNEDSSE